MRRLLVFGQRHGVGFILMLVGFLLVGGPLSVMASAYKEAFDEGGFAWDDASNNRTFLSNTCSSTSNGASIYPIGSEQARHLSDREGNAAQGRHFHTPLPKGAAGQFSYHVAFSNLVMGYSKNQKAAKDFLRWVCSKEIYDQGSPTFSPRFADGICGSQSRSH